MREAIARRLKDLELAEISRVTGISGAILKQLRDNPQFRPRMRTVIKVAAACGVTECTQTDS